MDHEAEKDYLEELCIESNHLLVKLLNDHSTHSSTFTELMQEEGEKSVQREEDQNDEVKGRCRRFNLLDDNQQFYIVLPEQFIQESSEDSSQILNFTKKNAHSNYSHSIHVPNRIPRPYQTNESRSVKLQRYRYKRLRRDWQKKIVYKCRKEVADKRQRQNGRFIKKQPANMLSPQMQRNSPSNSQVQFIKSLQLSRNDFQQLLL